MPKLWQFLKGHPKPTFSKKVQRGDQEKFFKTGTKSSLGLKGLKALWRTYSTKNRKDFGAKGGSKSSQMAKLWQFWPGNPNPAFSEKGAKGGPREIFQKSPKN